VQGEPSSEQCVLCLYYDPCPRPGHTAIAATLSGSFVSPTMAVRPDGVFTGN